MKAIIGKDLDRAAAWLREGGLVALPTETVYGLGANALNPKAVLRIFEAKNRPSFDPLIVHIGNWEQVAELVLAFPTKAQRLVEKHWPGPLTIVLKKKPLIPDLVTSGLDTVGLRMPMHPLSLELLQKTRIPVAAPSANPFGYVSPTTAAHVADRLGTRVDYILDGGQCRVGVESTIVSFAEETPRVLRTGGLSLEAIRKTIGEVGVVRVSSSRPESPGMLSEHYATTTPIYIGNIAEMARAVGERRVAVLGYRSDYGLEGEVLSKAGNLGEAARNLFAAMRRLDNGGYEAILAEEVPNEGLGLAINDRLARASTRWTKA